MKLVGADADFLDIINFRHSSPVMPLFIKLLSDFEAIAMETPPMKSHSACQR